MLSPLEIAIQNAPTDEDRTILRVLRLEVAAAVVAADERGERVFIPALVASLAEGLILNAATLDLIEDEANFLLGDC